ncbi:MAG TPA: MIP/aquaporin family protein [Pyrinomonadaceae bacterium]|nr:MIP/aquaporin family protein [Pyrinomonadaceae bacterium]
MPEETFSRRLTAEFLGTALLVAAVVGSGIMAERLADGNQAVALLANTIATGAALFVLIVMFAPLSGAHFNTLVSIGAAVNRDITSRDAAAYVGGQVAGGILGSMAANAMFGLPAIQLATKVRTGGHLWLAESVATFGLVGVIIAVSRRQSVIVVAAAVALYITAAYWFTSSTSFANPAVTIARMFSDTFTGIRPIDVGPFIAAQFAGAAAATGLFNWLFPKEK